MTMPQIPSAAAPMPSTVPMTVILRLVATPWRVRDQPSRPNSTASMPRISARNRVKGTRPNTRPTRASTSAV